jgi:hypothetical protein
MANNIDMYQSAPSSVSRPSPRNMKRQFGMVAHDHAHVRVTLIVAREIRPDASDQRDPGVGLVEHLKRFVGKQQPFPHGFRRGTRIRACAPCNRGIADGNEREQRDRPPPHAIFER